MDFFRRIRRSRATLIPSTGHSQDDQLLGIIGGTVGGLVSPREWIHYVYCDSADGAATLEAAAIVDGWEVRRVSQGEGIIATRMDLPVNPITVPEVRKFFMEAASRVKGGEYDGWEAAT
ncbi:MULTISPECIES: hypothetical protein [Cryobacterium]|uniref:Uncharacterized protein n=1 Tax=Cryobacterium glucosi TaxID=1259175 RepID=A0ABY2IQP8_9MICO|nr:MULTISPECIES: hypothetical protein [Cryobacterium]TFB99728.1 hypothetical protein E3O39_03015 [Cryobacterium sp. MDB2-A-1]TFC09711.1 hypothetical protein E3O35_14205 [Cryobacterium sp. MDB2-A-2]TFC13545.1 hypothetical protein E3O51_18070 [Cryobacterium sp. MDB2-10]TFC22663.1 hypothetical protein E3O46_04295 [Cryobacterium glucosi]